MAVTGLLRLIIRDKKKKLHAVTKVSSHLNRALTKSLGIEVRVNDPAGVIHGSENYLILSNHVSYLDIFVIFSYFPASFIASVDEVRETFLLGRVTELSGGFFVERRSRSGLREEIKSITGLLDMGLNVALFPEGTPSNGEGVLPFKTPLISIAQRAGVNILPVCMKYTGINGEQIGPGNRDLVYYYGDMNFFDHFFKLLTLKSIDAELTVLEEINTGSALSRKELADAAYSAIESAYAGRESIKTAV